MREIAGSVHRPAGTIRPRAPANALAAAILAAAALHAAAQSPATWIAVQSESANGAQAGSGTFDLRRGRLVRFFDFGRHFEGAGGRWLPVPVALPPQGPVARHGHAIAFDAARGRIVLFGGRRITLLSDTWEWDGDRWRQLVSVATPPRRIEGAMACDERRGVMVLCGGSDDAAQTLVDTWELVGDQWRPFAGTTPAYGPRPAMAFDAARGEILLVGAGAFHFDGVQWRAGDPAIGPVDQGALAFDPSRQVAVAWRRNQSVLEFDGAQWRSVGPSQPDLHVALHYDPDARTIELNETTGHRGWHWDGIARRERPHAAHPAFGSITSFVDPVRGVIVAVGLDAQGLHRTWTTEGREWNERPTSAVPPTHRALPCAFDTARGRGWCFDTGGDLWSWDGGGWMRVGGGPPTRHWFHLAYDSRRDRLVFAGGILGFPIRELWEWDGTSWALLAANGPRLDAQGAMAFDPLRGRTVAYDGTFGATATLEWDGVQWQTLPVATPGPLTNPQMVFEPGRGRAVLLGDTGLWEFDGAAWLPIGPGLPRADRGRLHVDPVHGELVSVGGGGLFVLQTGAPEFERIGRSCGRPSAVLHAHGLPRAGDPHFALQAASEASAPTWFALSAAPTDVVLANGCRLLAAPPWILFAAVADGRGLATMPLPLQHGPHLVGLGVFAQAAALLPNQPGGFATTQALRLRIGG